MKNYRFIIIVLATAAAFQLTSCEQNGLKSKLMGKWRISDMHIQYYEQREKYGQDQIKMLQDSLGRTSDTATTKRIGAQITQIQDQINAFKATQDSAIAKSSWEFKDKGEFVANESDGPKNGVWSYDPDLNMLFTVIDNQTSSVKVKFEQDTMTLQLDSVNYMKFTPYK